MIEKTIKIKGNEDSFNRKQKNVAKHLRIAKATKGIEKQGHLEKAEKLLNRYGW